MFLKLAWRNIWRNKKRSVIILISIVIGIIAIIFFEALSVGLVNQMLDNQISIHTAHIQVHKHGFNDEKLVQNYLPNVEEVVVNLKKINKVKFISRRVISYGLITTAEKSSGILIVGVVPEEERNITKISEYVIEGNYFLKNKNEILISKRLAKSLGISLNEKIVLLASRVDGKVGSELFRVIGIFQTPNSAFDKSTIYINLRDAQEMLGLGNNISEITIISTNVNEIMMLKENIAHKLGPNYEVLSYRELIPSLVVQQEMTGSWMLIIYVIIGLAMIFGIINTFLMSVFERINEFGVLKAIGMHNRKLFLMIIYEAIFLGILGSFVGSVLGLTLVIYLSKVGLNFAVFAEGLSAWGISAIIYPEVELTGVVKAVVVIIVISVLASMYPALKALRLQPVQAIRHI